ncbi:uncharacterized protein LOC115237633 [Formica exsecta]|uniref:uncharacterized protein LOC115237633 n=1 Tax=Formica exsecta TaxID=72781 RepID=UPI001143CB1E|nr:uncharacterized protein LOC115237633 [Formica exsecta]
MGFENKSAVSLKRKQMSEIDNEDVIDCNDSVSSPAPSTSSINSETRSVSISPSISVSKQSKIDLTFEKQKSYQGIKIVGVKLLNRMTLIQFVNTCGVCEEIIDNNKISIHKCVEGYKQVYIDANRYFYPICDNGQIIRRSLINNTEKIVRKRIDEISIISEESSETHSNFLDSTDIEELLIEEVAKHEVLYNYSLPIQERNRYVISEIWTEISKALNGRLDPKQAAKKWKTLRDSYSRELAKEKLPSGSRRPTLKRKWKYFDRMNFLRDTIYTKKTSDNLLDGDNLDGENNKENIPQKRGRISAISTTQHQLQLLQSALFQNLYNCRYCHFQTNRMKSMV